MFSAASSGNAKKLLILPIRPKFFISLVKRLFALSFFRHRLLNIPVADFFS